MSYNEPNATNAYINVTIHLVSAELADSRNNTCKQELHTHKQTSLRLQNYICYISHKTVTQKIPGNGRPDIIRHIYVKLQAYFFGILYT
jgi:hypothetical protein